MGVGVHGGDSWSCCFECARLGICITAANISISVEVIAQSCIKFAV
jgi:hypothetical protein